MNSSHLATPWAPRSALYSLPGSLVVKLVLGEAPDDIPSKLDVRARATQPAVKLDGGPIDRLVRHHAGSAQITRVHVAAKSLACPSRRHVGFNDVEHVSGLARTFRIDTGVDCPVEILVDALNQLPHVESAYPEYVCAVPFDMTRPDPDPALAWEHRNLISAAGAMAYEPGDPGVIVAVVDSGVASLHPELAGRFRPGFDTVQLGATDLATGIHLLGDLAQADTDPTDDYVGHGMGCAGIIGALGEHIPPGLAGDCRILPIRVLGAAKVPGKAEPIGIGAVSDIDCGMKMAVDLGARVINMSFGTADRALDAHGPKPHTDVVQYALDRGCILVAASGNSGIEEVYWPAAFSGVISVGSVGVTGKPSAFTTRGPHVALCGPGERVATTGIDGYQLATGTSFAAPFASAVAALLVSRAQRRSFPLDAVSTRSLLESTTVPFSGGPVSGCGSGILDALAALKALDRHIDRTRAPDAQELTTASAQGRP